MTDTSSAALVLAEFSDLFWRARTSRIHGSHIGPGGRLYDVADTLQAVERELQETPGAAIAECPAAHRDLVNILGQRSEWETAADG